MKLRWKKKRKWTLLRSFYIAFVKNIYIKLWTKKKIEKIEAQNEIEIETNNETEPIKKKQNKIEMGIKDENVPINHEFDWDKNQQIRIRELSN